MGKFDLMDIQPAPRGVPQIEVAFELDANGILSVSAADKKNPPNSKSITIESHQGRLSEDKIARIVADAVKFKSEDDEKRKTIEAKNELEGALIVVFCLINYSISQENSIHTRTSLSLQISSRSLSKR